ncbi:MAG: PQQ-dependent sugar dehydrogenase [Burkholderiales bacterium]|nr:PQQ-dependent sugar dehydrogenase [Burkholderiales bacterium]
MQMPTTMPTTTQPTTQTTTATTMQTTLPRRAAALLLAATAIVAATAMLATPAAATAKLKPVIVARGLVNPWALAFLPDGRMLVTEKPGRLRIVDAQGRISPPLAGVPPVANVGQCGLLDVALDPKFADNRLVYWTFAEPGSGGANSTAVARARLEGEAGNERLADVRVIFSQVPKVESRQHCGSRIAFDRAGHLWVGLGDRFSRKDSAQITDNHIGKVVRIAGDGSVPADNPFIGKAGARPELWSIGHRNIQGLAVHPVTGELWASEHGPQGGDEINVVEGGRNYGWPLVTYGRNYGSGTVIGEEGPKAGIEMPLKHWVPVSVAPSGLAFLTSDRYPGWKGSLMVGTLRAQTLVRLTLDGRRITGEERLLTALGHRIRDVRQGPDGWIYIVTDGSEGQIIRIER